MTKEENGRKRRMLVLGTGAVGVVGALGGSVPFIASMAPSARARAAGAPVEVDLENLEPGMMVTVEWRGKPVWVLHRTEEMVQSLSEIVDKVQDPSSSAPMQPEYAGNDYRSIKPEYLVLVGICTHLGCSPTQKLMVGPESGLGDDWRGGFFCPCHGSKFDLAGRVYKGVPAPVNLEVPPHMYTADNAIIIGEEKKA